MLSGIPHRFCLIFRGVEELLAERGVVFQFGSCPEHLTAPGLEVHR